MTRFRFIRIGLVAAALAAVALVSASAWAHRRGRHALKGRISAHLDGALDAAKATPEQRQAIYAARDHVLDAFKAGRGAHKGGLEEVLTLFQADSLDPAALAAQREKRQAEAKRLGDAIAQALYDAHAALTPEQRRAVVDYVRAHKPADGRGGLREAFFHKMVDARLGAALDAIKAPPAQRATVTKAKDDVVAAFAGARPDHGAELERVLTLFAQPSIDAKAVEALRAEHQAKLTRVGDAMRRALTDVHAALTPEQRKVLVEHVRAHRPKHHHGRRR